VNLISADGAGKSLGGRVLFEELTFGIQDHEKIALIGENGCGKTTLLRILAGREQADRGTVVRNKLCSISYLEQVAHSDPDDTVIAHILRGESPRAVALRRYELCAEKARDGDAKSAEGLIALSEEMERLGAWDYERRVQSVLQGFGIHDLSARMGSLSGGTIKKVAIAQTLVEEANCLFLDEPTNHLDVDSIVWLQEYLKRWQGAVVMVTHDRYFLDEICTGIYEIEQRKLFFYEGNYSYYLEKRSQRVDAMIRTDRSIENILRTELEWLRRGPKARGTKSKARKDRITELLNHNAFREADSIEIAVTGKRLGKKILEVDSISKSYGPRTIISDFSHIFKQGERIGVVGANGSGKTTILNLLTGCDAPDSGTISAGVNTVFGYFTQTSESEDPAQCVIDYIETSGKTVMMADGSSMSASKMLETFLFPSGLHRTPIGKLSGGERRRLFLLKVLMGNPNFLVLDEPTNDFDIKTLSILGDFLRAFTGCIIVVSHDRYFMDHVTDYVFVLDGSGSVKSFPGSFSEYLDFTKQHTALFLRAEQKENAPAREKPKKEKIRLNFNEQREYDSIENDIHHLEKEHGDLLGKINTGTDDHTTYTEWGIQLAELEKRIDEKYARWEYLERFTGAVSKQ
jgi:ATP-binding cassette subfamily F protein uup